MGYATVADVQALDQGRQTFTAQTKPPVADIQRYLAWTAGEIDGILASRDFTLPVPTGATAALALLAGYNAQGANCLLQRSAQNSRQADTACAAWEAAKKALAVVDLGQLGAAVEAGSLPSITDNPGPMFDMATVMDVGAVAPTPRF